MMKASIVARCLTRFSSDSARCQPIETIVTLARTRRPSGSRRAMLVRRLAGGGAGAGWLSAGLVIGGTIGPGIKLQHPVWSPHQLYTRVAGERACSPPFYAGQRRPRRSVSEPSAGVFAVASVALTRE